MQGALFLLRLLFVITTASISYQIAFIFYPDPFHFVNILSIFIGTFGAIGIILLEINSSGKIFSIVFTGIFGLLVGFIASNLFIQTFLMIPQIQLLRTFVNSTQLPKIQNALEIVITFFFCYLSLVVLAKTKNRFKILVPFIEFQKSSPQERILVVDSSVIIDGRILNIIDTNIIVGTLTIPKFILNELQSLADSSDKVKRNKGRRAIEILAELEKKTDRKCVFDPETMPNVKEVDNKLLQFTKKCDGILVTNDYNLHKIANLQHIEVINLNAVANAFRPPVLPGNILHIQILKQGEEPTQGIGYLEDGTVIVVDNGWGHKEKYIDVTVTNVLQTNVGRMIFAKYI